MIQVTCACGKQLECPDDKAGKRGRCPFCQAVIVMPAAPVDLSRFTFMSAADEACLRRSIAEGSVRGYRRQGETVRRSYGTGMPLEPKPKGRD